VVCERRCRRFVSLWRVCGGVHAENMGRRFDIGDTGGDVLDFSSKGLRDGRSLGPSKLSAMLS
jgi:hypothetical protein